jgi:AraC-like DNA-binding protein
MDNFTIKDGFMGQKMIVLPESIKEGLKTNVITKNFYIKDIGYYPKANFHQRSRKKGADEFILIYCTEGQGKLTIASEQILVLPNRYYIIPKRTAHKYGADDLNPWSIYWMHFDGLIAQSLFDRYRSNPNKYEIVPFDSGRIEQFNQIFQILGSDYVMPRLEYANILGLNFLTSFVFFEIDRSIQVNERNDLVDGIIDFLTNNLDKTLKSDDIANEFNYSSSYLFNLFKKRTGYSLIHFFNLKKSQKACEYLNYTDLSVKEISFKLGFEDPLYFSRLFKKYIGVPPKAYKAKQSS